MYKVYALKEGDVVMYIGITKQALSRRLQGHISDSKRNKNPRKSAWINNMLLLGKKIIIECLFETDSKSDVNSKEIEYISKYGASNLLNNTSGGGSNFDVHDSTKRKISEQRIGKYKGDKNPMYGKIREDLKNLNLSRDKQFYRDLSMKNSQRFTELYNTPEYITKNRLSQKNRKMVSQYDLNNNLIRIWDSLTQIETEGDIESRKKFWRKKVKLCLNGKYKRAHGFIWKWYTEEEI